MSRAWADAWSQRKLQEPFPAERIPGVSSECLQHAVRQRVTCLTSISLNGFKWFHSLRHHHFIIVQQSRLNCGSSVRGWMTSTVFQWLWNLYNVSKSVFCCGATRWENPTDKRLSVQLLICSSTSRAAPGWAFTGRSARLFLLLLIEMLLADSLNDGYNRTPEVGAPLGFTPAGQLPVVLSVKQANSVSVGRKEHNVSSQHFFHPGGWIVSSHSKWTWLVWAILTCDWFISSSFSLQLACQKYLITGTNCCVRNTFLFFFCPFSRTFSVSIYMKCSVVTAAFRTISACSVGQFHFTHNESMDDILIWKQWCPYQNRYA